MIYTEEFKSLINNVIDNETFIGSGNINSKILLIGKEAGIDTKNKMNRDRVHEKRMILEFDSNATKWKENATKSTQISDIKWDGIIEHSNPLFPFKGKCLSDEKAGHTWRKYQVLHDFIFRGNINTDTNSEYSFHNNFFLSELNSSPAARSCDADKKSIPGRIELLKNNKFFQDIPIVILACNEYIGIKNGVNQIEDTFKNVKYIDVRYFNKQPLYIHIDENIPKLVIHTWQLSSFIRHDLLKGLAEIIIGFSEKYNIDLNVNE
jgi:hypothetical protein